MRGSFVDNSEKEKRHRKRFVTRMNNKLEKKIYQEKMNYYDGFKRQLRVKPYERVKPRTAI